MKLTACRSRAGSSRLWICRLELVDLALMLARPSISIGKVLAPRAGRPCLSPPPDVMTSTGSKSRELGSMVSPSLALSALSYFSLRLAVDKLKEVLGVAGSYGLAFLADASLAMWYAWYVLGSGTLL